MRDWTDVAGPGGGSEGNGPYDLEAEYDSLYELKEAEYVSKEDGSLRRRMTYSYDRLGDMTGRHTVNGSVETDSPGEYYEKWFGTAQFDPDHPHRLVQAVGREGMWVDVRYDEIGGVTSIRVVNTEVGRDEHIDLIRDWNGQVVELMGWGSSGSKHEWNLYDATGKRVVKVVERGAGNQVSEYIAADFEVRPWGMGPIRSVQDEGERVARVEQGEGGEEVTWLVHDHLGSLRVSLDGRGAAKQTLSPLPFGGEEAKTGHDHEPYVFTGKEREQEWGLVYFGARWLNPALGRWMSADPEALSWGEAAYGYANNNVLILVDPEGGSPVAVLIGRPIAERTKKFRAMGFVVESFRRYPPVRRPVAAMRKALAVVWKGHHWMPRGSRQLVTKSDPEGVLIKEKWFAKRYSFNRVRLFMHSGCNTMTWESLRNYRKIFPRAILAGWVGQGPNTKRDYIAEWVGKATRHFGGANGLAQALMKRPQAVVKALMAAGLKMVGTTGLPSVLGIYDPVGKGRWVLRGFGVAQSVKHLKGEARRKALAREWRRIDGAIQKELRRPDVPRYAGQREVIKAGGAKWLWVWQR